MRKWLLLALALLLALPTALAEAGAFVDVAGEYDFSSGAGAWYTGLTIQEDGILIQSVEPYGIGQGDAIRFFMRGALVSAIPEELWDWLRFKEVDPDWETLPYVALYDETSGAGFSGTIPAEGE